MEHDRVPSLGLWLRGEGAQGSPQVVAPRPLVCVLLLAVTLQDVGGCRCRRQDQGRCLRDVVGRSLGEDRERKTITPSAELESFDCILKKRLQKFIDSNFPNVQCTNGKPVFGLKTFTALLLLGLIGIQSVFELHLLASCQQHVNNHVYVVCTLSHGSKSRPL